MNKVLFPAAAALGLALAGVTSTASAADLGGGGSVYTPAPAYAPAPVVTWSGFYAGLDVGWVGYGADVSVDAGSDYGYKADGNGVQLGGTLGADWQFGSFVAGGLVDAHWSGAEPDGGHVGPASGINIDDKWGLDLLARAGYTPTQNILAYGLFGYSQESVGIAYDSTASGEVSSDQTLRGWTAGLGLEALLTTNVSVKGEYRYTNFGNESFGASPDQVTVDPHRNTVLVGINYRFQGLGF